MILEGRIRILDKDRTPIVAAILPQDVANYYLWFAQREAWVKFFTPKTPFHLTIISSKWDSFTNVKAARSVKNKKIKVQLLLGSMRINKIRRSGNIGLYCDVISKDALDFRRKCGILNPERRFGGHVTFGTTKSGIVDYWPEFTQIKS